MKKFNLKSIQRKLNGPSLTGSQASHMSIYGTDKPFEDILEEKMGEIDSDIKKNVTFHPKIKFVNYLVIPNKIELFEEIKKRYDERGFKTFYISSNRVEELGDDTLLFISWDNIKEKEEKC